MKKIRMMVILFILTFSFSVKAEVFMEIDCRSKNITSEKSITCDGNLVYEEITISDIEFEYQTNLDISFKEVPNFKLTKENNIIKIHADEPLHDEIMSSSVIMQFTLSVRDNLNEKEKLTFKNFKINNSNNTVVYDVSEEFNVTPIKTLNSICTLDSLTIDNVSVPNFSKDKFEYRDIEITKDIVFIDAVRSNEKSSATGLGQVYIEPGQTLERDVIVTAEDNSQNTYKLYITNKRKVETSLEKEQESVKDNDSQAALNNNQNKEVTNADTKEKVEELSNDNTLKSLEIFNGQEKINFIFDNKKNTFDITLDNETIEKVTIKATTNHDKALFVDQYGPRDIKINSGNNKVLIKVKAENSDIKTYTLNINRPISKSSDNTLSSLKINDKEINLVDDINDYEITLFEDAINTKIEAKASSDKAEVSYKDIELKDGENEVTILVTAENKEKREYHITILRTNKTQLDNIKIDGYNFNFVKNQKDYSLHIEEDTTELTIIIAPDNVDYEIIGNTNLQDGSVITIKVNDLNGESEYNISIIKKNNDSTSTIYIIIGIIVIMLLISISFILLKKKKTNKKDDIEII